MCAIVMDLKVIEAMSVKLSRRHFVYLGLSALAAVVTAGGGFLFMLWKDRSYFHSPAFDRSAQGPARVLVAYYSRSGNTEAMAREIARRYQADIARIAASAYSLDFTGWNAARRDAADRAPAAIEVPALDLAAYDLVFVGSPIWLYSPAPPLWTFVEKSDFKDRDVILFNTFNSRFKQHYIDSFAAQIEARGGRLLDHVFVRRGRIYAQISGTDLIAQVRRLLADGTAKWPVPPASGTG